MSLLLASRGKSHIVVMTDGFSLVSEEKGTRVEREDLQKMFASKAHPYVVAHHGLNRIGAFGCETLLPKLIKDDLDALWSRGLNTSVAKVIESLDGTVSQQLKAAKSPWVFGLWLAGLWPCTEIPELVELVWFSPGPGRVRVDVKAHGDVVWGGSGAKFVADTATRQLKDEKEAARLFLGPAEHSMAFLKQLYAAGLKNQQQAGENQFGGVARMALITEHGVDLDKV
jgi:hypothetical protein